MKKLGRVLVIAVLLVVLALLGVMTVRAFELFVVTGVNYLSSGEATAAPPGAAHTTNAPGDDPSWSEQTESVPVDMTADELGRAALDAAAETED